MELDSAEVACPVCGAPGKLPIRVAAMTGSTIRIRAGALQLACDHAPEQEETNENG